MSVVVRGFIVLIHLLWFEVSVLDLLANILFYIGLMSLHHLSQGVTKSKDFGCLWHGLTSVAIM